MSLARNIITIINNENRFTINEEIKTSIDGIEKEFTRKGMNAFKKIAKDCMTLHGNGDRFAEAAYIIPSNRYIDEFAVILYGKNVDGKYSCAYFPNMRSYNNNMKDYKEGRNPFNSGSDVKSTFAFISKYEYQAFHVMGEKVLEKEM
jgi:hypothetical protein